MRTLSIDALNDAVHGPIDMTSLGRLPFTRVIHDIIASPEFVRLRRIKQLGFVSKNYISAAHDRYAHSIGTMYMMRRVVDRLRQNRAFTRPDCDILAALRLEYPNSFSTSEPEELLDQLAEHLMLAALIQDIGELPYNMATAAHLRPSEKLKATATTSARRDIDGLEAKTVFALAWLGQPATKEKLKEFDIAFLTDLLAGKGKADRLPGLQALTHIVDGALDADRLDYVHRDAFHVLGIKRDPTAVLSALLYYDEDGPVLSSSAPIADFLAVRATLWSSVYLSPPNRFRLILLALILKSIEANGDARLPPFFETGLDYEHFSHLDDAWADRLIDEIQHGRYRLKTDRADRALAALSRGIPKYEYFWLREPIDEGEVVGWSPPAGPLPTDLFVDSYSEFARHRLYDPGSIRVHVPHYEYIGGAAPLEECSGPFNGMLTTQASGLPMPGCISVFTPAELTQRPGPAWRAVDEGMSSGALYYRLRSESVADILDFEPDTRGKAGYSGPHIFISFAWEDIEAVRGLAKELARRKRHYYCLIAPFSGAGGTARQNSQDAVEQAKAVILLYSQSYASKLGNHGGNVAAEVYEMMRRVRDGLVVVPLSVEEFDHASVSKFPWHELGFTDGAVPMMGQSLRGASDSLVRAAIDASLSRIDEVADKTNMAY